MNFRKPLIVAATATAIVVGSALPASAAPGDPVDTAATFTLEGGDLLLSAPAGADLGPDASGTTAITGTLGATTVTDARGGVAEWSVSAASTTFVGDVGGSTSTAVVYTAGTVAESGTITVADGTAADLTAGAQPVVTPTSLSGNNTASWTAGLAVTMPADALADDYAGTVTTSIL
jgi:hypothetical protein